VLWWGHTCTGYAQSVTVTAERKAFESIEKIDNKHELDIDACKESNRQPNSLECTFKIKHSTIEESFALGIVMGPEWDGFYLHTTVWSYDG
jgi:hypothetical protein